MEKRLRKLYVMDFMQEAKLQKTRKCQLLIKSGWVFWNPGKSPGELGSHSSIYFGREGGYGGGLLTLKKKSMPVLMAYLIAQSLPVFSDKECFYIVDNTW